MTLTIPILEHSLAEDVGGVSQAFNTYFTNVPNSRFLEGMAMDSKYLFCVSSFVISCFIYTDSKHHLCNIRILSRIILTYTTVSRQQIYIFPVKCFFEDSFSSCCLAEDISLITPS